MTRQAKGEAIEAWLKNCRAGDARALDQAADAVEAILNSYAPPAITCGPIQTMTALGQGRAFDECIDALYGVICEPKTPDGGQATPDREA